MPPVDRQHEGFGFLRRREGAGNFGMTMGGILLRLDWEPLRERELDHGSGQTRMPPQERRHEEVFVLGDSFTRTGETA